ncbi:ComEA family DNA-binding protein [Enterococcus timonensis]|uniref:ComEA family DNA-binding protein n=1 Tax=Enterococcus timonensis TaxID=1852364 RepID=UPI0008D9D56E|nr:ComEA family DNA-binding protein [Enterococcus timonensis]
MDIFDRQRKKKWLVIAGGVVGLFVLFIFGRSFFSTPQDDPYLLTVQSSSTFQHESQNRQSPELFEVIYVEVKGAIKNPGVYQLESGTRVFELLQQAGGLTEEADQKRINQAEILSDQQALYIPKVDEELSEEIITGSPETPAASGKININRADSNQLQTLPGIGEKKAQAIIDHRSQNGSFNTLESLMDVAGIGEATFTNLQELITIK